MPLGEPFLVNRRDPTINRPEGTRLSNPFDLLESAFGQTSTFPSSSFGNTPFMGVSKSVSTTTRIINGQRETVKVTKIHDPSVRIFLGMKYPACPRELT